MTLKAVIFDFGGVLLRWSPYPLYRQYLPNDAAIDQFLKEIDFNAWNLEQDRGRSFAEGVELHSKKFPHYAHLIRAYDEQWDKSITGAIKGTVDILNRLRGNGTGLYGLSNWSGEKFRLTKHKFEFFSWFDDIIISGDIQLIKPDPAIFHYTLKRIGLSASECVFIDDSVTNVNAARELGFAAIHFTTPEQLETELHQLGLLH